MVFLVDDDPDDLELVMDALCRQNFEGDIVPIENGKRLMERLLQPSSSLPELIVLDLNMPLKDGFQVLKEVKQEKRLASIPIAVVTASSSQQDEQKCRQLGCDLFAVKPSSLNEYDELVLKLMPFLKAS
jgi:DNA-binding response OmpR family regulator